MSLTPSNMLELGVKAPDFELENVIDLKNYTFSDVNGKTGTVVMFICQHCPYVIHVEDQLSEIAKMYQSKGVGFVAISSNDIEKYPQDSPEQMRGQVERADFTFPYLFDSTQEIAKKYDAACTPDLYVFDKDDILVYRGRIDGSRPNNDIPVTGEELRSSLDKLIEGVPQNSEQYPSMGCNIKWK